jgi:choline dehydrogenase
MALGGGFVPSFIDPETGTRSYSATAFYAPNAHRTNLSLLVEAYVKKIELEASKSGVRAAGVQFTAQGKQFAVRARREVIVCAGTVKSPQLLELSSIGSPALLESHGIPVLVANEGVGENLRDHPASLLAFELADGITPLDSLRDSTVLEEAKREFKEDRTGPMASGGVCSNDFRVLTNILHDEFKLTIARLVAELDAMDIPAGVKMQNHILARLLLSSSEPSGQYALGNGQFMLMKTDGDNISWNPLTQGNHVFVFTSVTHPF